MNEKNVSFKNYVILAGVLILSIILVIYFYKWYDMYEKSENSVSVLNGYLSIINYNEIDDYLVENKNAVIYISSSGTAEVKDFEKKFINIINKYDLNNNILFLDLSSEDEDSQLFNNIKLKYRIKNLPSFIVFKNGAIYDIYDIKVNNYSIDKVIHYLIEVGVVDD